MNSLQGLANSNDLEGLWINLKNIISDGTRKFIPLSGTWRHKPGWKRPVSKEIVKLIRKKHILWKRFMETREPARRQEYNECRNAVKNESRRREHQEQLTIAYECKANPKRFWGYIKSKTKLVSGIGDIKYADDRGTEQVIVEDEDKANVFADYFSTVFNQEPDDKFDTLEQVEIQIDMPALHISEEMVRLKLSKLKTDKSSGPDMVHPRVLKELSTHLSKPLAYLFNRSLLDSKVPADWQVSNVAVIHKRGSKSNVGNYRPISLTSIVCKQMESIIRDHIMDHFTANNLFSKKQFGFMKGRSTVLQLLKVLDMWTAELEEGGCIDVVYTDFEKAFDKVPHKRLLSKLKSYGLSDNIISWIEAFLCNRQQRVKIKGKFSKWHKVFSGIPQGTILGPLLFIIYINNLADECEGYANTFLFADDAKIFKHISSMEDKLTLQLTCDIVCKWSERWLMPLNAKKCTVLRIGKENIDIDSNYLIKVRGISSIMEHTTSIKDLGVIVDDKLNFREHINSKVNKAYSTLGIIKRNFKQMDRITFIKLYKSLVRSHLDYAVSVWSPHHMMCIEDIEKVQRRATKMVIECKGMNYSDRLRFLSLPTLAYRRVRADMIEVFKMLNGKYDQEVTPKLIMSHNSRTRGTSLKLETVRARFDRRKYSFNDRIVCTWNSLPQDIVTASSVNSFKMKLDSLWIAEPLLYDFKSSLSCIGVRGFHTH
jgi:hypothetical protein